MYKKHTSIKLKLTIVMMGVSLSAVLMTVLAITSYQLYDMRVSKIQELDITAAVTGDRNAAALNFQDKERAQRNLEIFRLSPAIMVACLYNVEGELFVGYQSKDAQSNLACPENKKSISRVLPEMIFSHYAIHQQDQVIGSTYLVSNTKDIDVFLHKIIQIATISTLLVLAIVLLMTLYFQHLITRPILELEKTARKITQKRDFSLTARVMHNDETGSLAKAFNDMLQEVKNRDEELMYVNETLEHKVLMRTRQLEEAKSIAEQANEAKSEFLRNISHEFRTPLHAMISFASYGIKESDTADIAEKKRYFQIILNSSERLSRLVNEVLDVARFEQNTQHFIMRRYDMSEILTRSTETMRALMQEKNITTTLDRMADDMFITCDHDRITQVITNILGNAIKFAPKNSNIHMRYGALKQEGENRIFVSFIDQGVGIPETEREAIFEPFRQSSLTKTGAGGTGLGLAICRGIIRSHGGQIWAENNDTGQGANVTFTLPRLQSDERFTINTMEKKHENAA